MLLWLCGQLLDLFSVDVYWGDWEKGEREKHTNKYRQIRPSKRNRRHDRTSPTNIPPRRPRKPKQANRHTETTHQRGVKSILRRHGSIITCGVGSSYVRLIEETIAEYDGAESEETADSDGEEDESGFFCAEGVDGFEDVGEGREEGEEDGEIESGVEGEEDDDGFGDEHVEGSCEGDCE